MVNTVYVGRVGALAVALGVGAAWLASPGIASAQEPSSASANGAETSTQRGASGSNEADTGTDEPRGPGVGAAQPSVAEDEPAEAGDGGDLSDELAEHAEDDDNAEDPAAADAPEDIEEPAVDDGGGGSGLDEQAEPEVAAENPPTSSDGTPRAAVGKKQQRGVDVVIPTALRAPEIPVDVRLTPAPAERTMNATAAADNAPIPVPVATQPVWLPRPTVGQVIAGIPPAAVGATKGIIAIALSPLLIPTVFGPSTPADPPAFWVLLAWARRQLFNSTPKLHPREAQADTTTGQIIGDLGASDADGDPITLAVTRGPAHGTLELDQQSGTYTYTPDKGYNGTDSFVVSVTDSGPDGVFGFLNPSRGHVSAVQISLTVPDGVERPDFVIERVDDNTVLGTGQVTGYVTSKGLAVLDSAPTRGSVVVEIDGTFTYTPTPTQRVAAFHSSDAVTDEFTVTVTDDAGVAQSFTVSVPVAPTGNALAYLLPAQSDRGLLALPTFDAITRRVYAVMVDDGYSTTDRRFSLIAVNADGTAIVAEAPTPIAGFPKLLINPVTGAGHIVGSQSVAAFTTSVTTITADGTIRSVTLDNSLEGEPVFDSAGNLYFTTADFRDTTVSIVSPEGMLLSQTPLRGRPRGLAVNPVLGVVYAVTRENGAAATVVSVLDQQGNVTESVRVPSSVPPLTGAITVNTATGTAYVVTSFITADGETPRSAVVVHGADGFLVTQPVDGTADRVVVDPAGDGRGYVLLTSPTSAPAIAVVTPDGATTPPAALPGDFASAWFAGERAIISTTAGQGQAVSVLDPDGTLTVLPGVLRGTPVVDVASGRVVVTTEAAGIGTVWFVASSGAPTGVEIAGAAAAGSALDPAGRVLQLAVGSDGRGTLHTFGADGTPTGQLILARNPVQRAPVVHPVNGTIYLLLRGDDREELTVLMLDPSLEVIAEHVTTGALAPDLYEADAPDGISDFIPNTVTGGSALLLINPDRGQLRLDYQVVVIGGDGSARVVPVDDGPFPARALLNPRSNPVTGTTYQQMEVPIDLQSNPGLRLFGIPPDGDAYTYDDLPGRVPVGGLLIDPASGTAFQLTWNGIWVVDVNSEPL